MSENAIYTIEYSSPTQENKVQPIAFREVWRYAGYKGVPSQEESELTKLLEQVIKEMEPHLIYRVCYRRMELSWQDGIPALPFEAQSQDLAKCLQGCNEIILFAATIGLELDRRIAREQYLFPTKALLLQALGAERIEALCDTFCLDIKQNANEKGLQITPRFSPGYGDLPLEVQKDFFRLLDCNRKIGVTLNQSLLMTPSKSVTAIFGLYQK